MSRFRDSFSRIGQIWSGGQAPASKNIWPEDPKPLAVSSVLPRADIIEIGIEVLLGASSPLLPFTREDALIAMDYLVFEEVSSGTVVMTEGDKTRNDFVAILLMGEVRVDTTLNPGHGPQTFSIRTRGSAMGAVGFLDGLPRWGTHVAISTCLYASLTREKLTALLTDAPTIGAKFLLAIAQMLAETQRDYISRLKVLSQINRSLQDEILESSTPADGTQAATDKLSPGGSVSS